MPAMYWLNRSGTPTDDLYLSFSCLFVFRASFVPSSSPSSCRSGARTRRPCARVRVGLAHHRTALAASADASIANTSSQGTVWRASGARGLPPLLTARVCLFGVEVGTAALGVRGVRRRGHLQRRRRLGRPEASRTSSPSASSSAHCDVRAHRQPGRRHRRARRCGAVGVQGRQVALLPRTRRRREPGGNGALLTDTCPEEVDVTVTDFAPAFLLRSDARDERLTRPLDAVAVDAATLAELEYFDGTRSAYGWPLHVFRKSGCCFSSAPRVMCSVAYSSAKPLLCCCCGGLRCCGGVPDSDPEHGVDDRRAGVQPGGALRRPRPRRRRARLRRGEGERSSSGGGGKETPVSAAERRGYAPMAEEVDTAAAQPARGDAALFGDEKGDHRHRRRRDRRHARARHLGWRRAANAVRCDRRPPAPRVVVAVRGSLSPNDAATDVIADERRCRTASPATHPANHSHRRTAGC